MGSSPAVDSHRVRREGKTRDKKDRAALDGAGGPRARDGQEIAGVAGFRLTQLRSRQNVGMDREQLNLEQQVAKIRVRERIAHGDKTHIIIMRELFSNACAIAQSATSG